VNGGFLNLAENVGNLDPANFCQWDFVECLEVLFKVAPSLDQATFAQTLPVACSSRKIFLDPRTERSVTGALCFRLAEFVRYPLLFEDRVSLASTTGRGNPASGFLGGRAGKIG
jgi:hypothetical protein